MAGRNLIRIAAVAVCLSTLSFAAGVAGDLSIIDPPRSGQRVVLRIPPEIPADAVRAAPLPPLLSTASAEASTPVRRSSRAQLIEAVEFAHEPEHAGVTVFVEAAVRSGKPQQDAVRVGQKPALQLASKPGETKPA
jgi:hypothetical protein